MSSHQPFPPSLCVGEVQHVQILSDQLEKLYLDEEYSDLTIIIDNTR